MLTGAQDVLDFWFGPAHDPGMTGRDRHGFARTRPSMPRSHSASAHLIEHALAGGIDDWASAPRTALAQVIVLDQLTR
jgi:uncharacterized protein (DUF924 family)